MISGALATGELVVERRDAQTDALLGVWRQCNRLYKSGIEVVWQRAFGVTVPFFTHLAAGQSSNPNNESMTALGDERYRAPLTSFIWNATTEEYVIRQIMGKTAGNGYTFREAMLVNSGTTGAGTMLCRAVYPEQAKDANIVLTFNWKLKLTRAQT